MKYKGMSFTKLKDGYKVSSDNGKYSDKIASYYEATMWIHEMADNNDIGTEFCHRICEKYGSIAQ